jgi:ribosomal protein L11
MVAKKPMTEKKAAKDLNKSEEIRKLAKVMKEKGEKPRPVAIIAALKKQGIEVSSPQVSMVLKRMGFRPRKRRKNGSDKAAIGAAVVRKSATGRTDMISFDDLIAAKKIVSQLGGTDRALATIAALKRFES